MTVKRDSTCREWLRRRGVWFWATVGTLASVLLLWGGSQIARDRGQSVEWYTGFGQWLGGLGSLIAAAVALWIAVTERRRAEQQHEADLAREAGLVRVTARMIYERGLSFGPTSLAAVRIQNRRMGRIFEIEVTKFVMDGNEVRPLLLASIDLCPKRPDSHYTVAELPYLSIETEQALYLVPNELPNNPADYVAMAYTDLSGRRWEVDTDGKVQRVL
ncbi:hypothetical protein MMARE11_19920 [Mycobacterium marinum E11]|nr:hypothetical protein MMARE11_19920 [Mycobacterium marinum E11]